MYAKYGMEPYLDFIFVHVRGCILYDNNLSTLFKVAFHLCVSLFEATRTSLGLYRQWVPCGANNSIGTQAARLGGF